MRIYSFAPISSPMSRVLILGTMPGKTSLRENQYYAHPRNAFWVITGAIVGFEPDSPYELRVKRLLSSGLALWDVLRSCERKSSLDSDIDVSTESPNDLTGFLESHPAIRRICFNGAKAEALFSKHVPPESLDRAGRHYVRLPSTSPANASIPLAKKILAWRAICLP
jgi:double-stranded uracil-DNA glycosylase